VLVPAATPKTIVATLHREIVRIVAQPEMKERLDAIGFVPVANTPDELAAVIAAETTRWGKVIREAGIKAE
jgi:tripartite-type tricarboxylate transporter receptor subunit TctC